MKSFKIYCLSSAYCGRYCCKFGMYMITVLYECFVLLSYGLFKIHVSFSCSVSSQNGNHQLASRVCVINDLCTQLLVRQERFEEFMTDQLHLISSSLNEILTLLASHHRDTSSQKSACFLINGTHTPPLDEIILEETFSLPISSTPVKPAATAQPDQGIVDQFELPMSRLLAIKSNSCSRENFAANVNKELFSKEERMHSNVKGVLDKMKLNTQKISYIQQQTFQFFPLMAADNRKQCWARCVRAIDSCNRQLLRGVRRSLPLQEK